ncbi:hypothetical protein A4A49_10321 [Nicotiana attenuata]|uniref:Uncharacterized protein n=1 Tax=Nicotiana attenuata TaxID=49451 RepID=A0A314KQF9_NICAT|nr:hypothetical protein A4A49_10321 [Nicotiana attenuata]
MAIINITMEESKHKETDKEEQLKQMKHEIDDKNKPQDSTRTQSDQGKTVFSDLRIQKQVEEGNIKGLPHQQVPQPSDFNTQQLEQL